MYLFALGAIIISFSPILVKAISAMGPTAIGAYRCLFATAALLPLFCYEMSKGYGRKKWGREVIYLLIAGFSFSLDLYSWNRSVIYAGAGISTILGNTQAIYLALLGIFISKEKVTKTFMVALPLALMGILLIADFKGNHDMNSRYLEGVFYGLLTGVFYGGYVFFLRKSGQVNKNFSAIQQMFFISLFTAFFLVIFASCEQSGMGPFPTGNNLYYLLTSGVIVHSVGWFCITKALPTIPISISGLMLLIQPVLAILWGILIFQEELSWMQFAGATLTLSAIYLGSGSGKYLMKYIRSKIYLFGG